MDDELESLLLDLELDLMDDAPSRRKAVDAALDPVGSVVSPGSEKRLKEDVEESSNSTKSDLTNEERLICHACQQEITGKYLRALKKDWHPEHFVCSACTKPLSNAFYEGEGGVICKECASEKYKCCECNKQIVGSHLVYPDGRKVHADCVPKIECAKCGDILSLAVSHVEAMDKYWHSECFICTSCSKVLGTTFIQYNDQPYCKSCVDKLIEEKENG